MKELSIEEKALLYDEALKYAMIYYKEGNKDMKMMMKTCFPILAEESEDERIRKELLNYLYDVHDDDEERASWIDWLEKQSEKELANSAKTRKDEDGKKIRQFLIHEVEETSDKIMSYRNMNKEDVLTWLKKQGEQKPAELNDNEIWNRAKEVFPDSLNMQSAFVSGYKETAKFYKSTDKVEPKFKVGDWIIRNTKHTGVPVQVIEFKGYYRCDLNGEIVTLTLNDVHNNFHLWTIRDAKDGDVLVNGSNIFIFNFINYTRLMGYCYLNTDNGRFYDNIGRNECFCPINAVVNPATKEQRDLLFQKMKEAGYQWDVEKKELEKIEQKQVIDYQDNLPKDNWELVHEFIEKFGRIPKDEDELNVLVEYVLKRQKPTEWSEEDEVKINRIVACLKNLNVADNDILLKDVDWLKSLRHQNTWKPSDEQMNAFDAVLVYNPPCSNACRNHLITLYNDLKKLREE